MFARFVFPFLGFCAREFPAKPEKKLGHFSRTAPCMWCFYTTLLLTAQNTDKGIVTPRTQAGYLLDYCPPDSTLEVTQLEDVGLSTGMFAAFWRKTCILGVLCI